MHHHSHHHTPHEHPKASTKAFTWAFFLNFSFTIIEFIGGVLTNSVAIISDAIHDLGDTIALAFAWYMERVSGKKRNKDYTFGFRRFSVLGALVNSSILLVGSLIITGRAIWWFFEPLTPHAEGMMALALLGILVNGFAFFKLYSKTNLNQRTASLHLLEDVLGWVAVLVGGFIISRTGWNWIDPALSILIATFIFRNALKNLRACVNILLQRNPGNVNPEKLEAEIKNFAGVTSVHDMHIWTLDGNFHVISLHVVVEDSLDRGQLKSLRESLREALRNQGFSHITIETEHRQESTQPQIS